MRLLVYGSRTFAETMADLALDCGHEVMGMVDDSTTGSGIVGTLDEARRLYAPSEYGIVLGIGYSDFDARWDAWLRVRAAGWATPALVHPRAYVARTAALAEGCAVMAGAIVDRQARLGQAVVVWPGACICHDANVGDNSFVSPNATLCGFVRVGCHSFIGAGAVVAEDRELPERSFVRMNSSHTKRTA